MLKRMILHWNKTFFYFLVESVSQLYQLSSIVARVLTLLLMTELFVRKFHSALNPSHQALVRALSTLKPLWKMIVDIFSGWLNISNDLGQQKALSDII